MRTVKGYLANKRGILALLAVLALMALLATQAVWAQDEEDDPCTEDRNGGRTEVRCTYAENDTDPVATFKATSPEGDEFEFSLDDLDAADFTIDSRGRLRFKSRPDYENPTDRVRTDNRDTEDVDEAEQAEDNEYFVTVRTTDVRPVGAKGAAPTSTVDVIVTVTNLDERGTADISLRQPEVGTELTASVTDPDKGETDVSYEWSVPKVSRPALTNDAHWQGPAGTDNIRETYTPAAGADGEGGDIGKWLRLKATYDDDEGDDKVAYVRSEFRVRADVTDDNNTTPAFDENNATTTRKVSEDADVGDAVGKPVVADDNDQDDKGRLTYTIGAGADADSFSIDKRTGQIKVAAELDHELGSGDISGITIDGINDVEDKANAAVMESAAANDGIYVIVVTVTDPSGDRDDENTDSVVVVITATNVDEAPSVKGKDFETAPDTTHRVPEGRTILEVVDPLVDPLVASDAIKYLAVPTDDNDVVSLSLSGDDSAAFQLVDADGMGPEAVHDLSFKEAPNFEKPTDANKDNAYKLKVVARDDAGNRSETDVTVTVTNISEEGGVKLSSIQPAVGTQLKATLTDPDGDVTNVSWQWYSASTADGGFDEIDDATSATYTPTAGDPMDEDDTGDIGNYLQVAVTYNDAQQPYDKDSVTNTQLRAEEVSRNAVRELPETNAAPVFTERSVTREVAENTVAGGSVGEEPVRATDDDDDVLTYSLSGGADRDAFKIDQESGQIEVGDDTKLDFEGDQNTYTVEVKAEDPFALSDTVTVTIKVTNVDEAPVLGLRPDNVAPEFAANTTTREVAENTAAGEDIGDPVRATDDDNDRLTYTMGGDDAASFAISRTSGQIRTKAALDYETKASYTVRVKAEDPDALSDTITVTIIVTGVDEAPAVSGNAAVDYAENGAGMVATYAATDPENGDIAWSLSGDDADDFEISGAGMLTFMSPPDFENPMDANTDNMYSVMVVASDGTNDGAMGVTVTVTDVDENVAPEFAEATTTREVEENTPQGANIGGPVAAMAGDDDTLTYAIGGADASSFVIIRTTGQIKVREALDYETKNSYTVTITATDESDLSDTITVAIMVTDKVGLENAYDVNDDGVIDRSEALNAVDDYFAPGSTLTKAEVLEVIALYLG